MKKCIYCQCVIDDERAVDVCDKCGVGVWGQRMFKAIIKSMDDAKEKGDLFQGSVCEVLERDELDRKSFF